MMTSKPTGRDIAHAIAEDARNLARASGRNWRSDVDRLELDLVDAQQRGHILASQCDDLYAKWQRECRLNRSLRFSLLMASAMASVFFIAFVWGLL